MPRETGAESRRNFMDWRGVRTKTHLPTPDVGPRNRADTSGMPEGELGAQV